MMERFKVGYWSTLNRILVSYHSLRHFQSIKCPLPRQQQLLRPLNSPHLDSKLRSRLLSGGSLLGHLSLLQHSGHQVSVNNPLLGLQLGLHLLSGVLSEQLHLEAEAHLALRALEARHRLRSVVPHLLAHLGTLPAHRPIRPEALSVRLPTSRVVPMHLVSQVLDSPHRPLLHLPLLPLR